MGLQDAANRSLPETLSRGCNFRVANRGAATFYTISAYATRLLLRNLMQLFGLLRTISL